MSFLSILEKLFIGPLKLIFEIIFEISNRFVQHPGFAIIFLSLIMNLLVLPLYRRADVMQEESRDIEARLEKGVRHIKKTFSGDERMMILQTYYRQNNYKPTQALNGSVSLLLEIPFFMAAYQFLSGLDVLDGVSFGPIKDLGAPDGLLVIGALSINVLPVLMTLINVISSALYLKGFPLKTKIQLYAMAAFFLVFLYTSPSCLVFYWTLNNLFSLVKTIFYKLPNPKKVLLWLSSLLGIAAIAFGLLWDSTPNKKLFIVLIGLALELPLLFNFIKDNLVYNKTAEPVPNVWIFRMGCVFLTALTGLLIPTTFISASPQEYVNMSAYHNPLWYIVSTLCLAAGTFIVWMGVFYWIASPKGKVIFDNLVWILSGITLVNYMFFGTKLGNMTPSLQFEKGLKFSTVSQIINLLVILAIIAVFTFIFIKWKRAITIILLTGAIAMGGMSVVNINTINNSVKNISVEQSSDTPHFEFSKSGKNVVVVMLDRAMNEYVPYIFNELPELKEKFAGFTYYANTVSFGGYTNFASPPLLGGYEYTPVEMNKRSDELLVTKHNEALKVMPTVFSRNGFEVTVCDPVYANYQWYPDLKLFDGMPNTKAFITKGVFGSVDNPERLVKNNHRNLFCFSLMKSMPLILQPFVYNNGMYNRISYGSEAENYTDQKTNGPSVANGISDSFMQPYNVLCNLGNMTRVTEKEKNTYLFLCNDTTHEPILLKEPEYEPFFNVNNTEYDNKNADRFVLDGKKLIVENANQMAHYQTNVATLKRLGDWFDYMRKEGVYDSTRIILVADHGRHLFQNEDLIMGGKDNPFRDVEYFYPLFMVKDFGSKEFTTSEEFMTNADVPTMAFEGLIENPVNPFTGKEINNDEKYAHDQFVLQSSHFSIQTNNGKTFLPSFWASVNKDMRKKENWTFYEGSFILSEHKAPKH